MTSYLPTIKQLQYLVALHEHRHFGRAAEASFVSQSTLSAGIRELETLLDAALVERTRRVVRFTTLGQEVVVKAHRILREAEDLADLAQASGRPLTGLVRVSVIPTIAPFLLPPVLARLRRERPELQLQLREETSRDALEALRNGRVDCVLLALPFDVGEVDQELIAKDRLCLAFPKGDPRDPPDEVPPSMIDDGRLLTLEDGHCLTDHALAACGRPGKAGNTVVGTSLHTLVKMVEIGLGVTMLPEMALRAGILRGTEIEARPVKSRFAERQIALIWRRGSPRAKDFQLLAEELRKG
jgi:LysR family hydrogen peroxide-inducible transcriptional activator